MSPIPFHLYLYLVALQYNDFTGMGTANVRVPYVCFHQLSNPQLAPDVIMSNRRQYDVHCQNDAVPTPVRRNDVALASIWQHFDAMSPLGCHIHVSSRLCVSVDYSLLHS